MPKVLKIRPKNTSRASLRARSRTAERETSTKTRAPGSVASLLGTRFLHRRVIQAALAALFVGAIVLGSVEIYHSPVFQVRTVNVYNTRYVDTDSVVDASDLLGQNIFSLQWQGGSERIRENPMVRSVRVERQLPNTVRIYLEEREPWGFWEVGGGRYVVDRDGVVISRGLPVEGAPVVMQLDGGKPLSVGGRVDAASLELIRALQEELPGVIPGGRGHVVAYEFRNKDGLTVVLRGGLRVTFGDNHDLDFKLSALRTLLSRAPDASFVDLRFGDRIVFQAPERSFRP